MNMNMIINDIRSIQSPFLTTVQVDTSNLADLEIDSSSLCRQYLLRGRRGGTSHKVGSRCMYQHTPIVMTLFTLYDLFVMTLFLPVYLHHLLQQLPHHHFPMGQHPKQPPHHRRLASLPPIVHNPSDNGENPNGVWECFTAFLSLPVTGFVDPPSPTQKRDKMRVFLKTFLRKLRELSRFCRFGGPPPLVVTGCDTKAVKHSLCEHSNFTSIDTPRMAIQGPEMSQSGHTGPLLL